MALTKGKIIRRILASLVILIAALAIINADLVLYGIRQAKGQLHIIRNARPVDTFLEDPAFPDSLKAKLVLINEVRQFAIDSLGLRDTKNYKTLYDQQGKEIMWVVTACEPFALKPKEWTFPILGAVPYKGFFDRELAVELAGELEAAGWDVSVRNPGGWSTLGWFTDPILSKMLERGEGDLANLIIHEMSHATIFVKDSVDFNENLATFIGDRGAEQFLISTYGAASPEYQSYMNEDADYLKYAGHMLRGAEKLDSLYLAMEEGDPIEEKHRLKRNLIRRIVDQLDTLTLQTSSNPAARFKQKLPNNAYFMNFVRYQAKQDVFMEEWKTRFNGDLRAYIDYLAEKFPFL